MKVLNAFISGSIKVLYTCTEGLQGIHGFERRLGSFLDVRTRFIKAFTESYRGPTKITLNPKPFTLKLQSQDGINPNR